MSKYINADEFIKKVKREIDDCKDIYGRLGTIERYVASGAERALTILDKMPAADVAEVKHGEWIDYDDDYGSLMCSICEEDAPDDIPWDFCPHCGADMRGGVDNG